MKSREELVNGIALCTVVPFLQFIDKLNVHNSKL